MYISNLENVNLKKTMTLLKNFIILAEFRLILSNKRIIVYDEFHKIFDMNKKQLELSLEEAINRLVPMENREETMIILNEMYKKDKIEPFEIKGLVLGKEEKWVKIIAEYEYDKNGNKESIYGIIIDISESKEKEENLKKLITLRESVLQIVHSVMDTTNLFTLFDIIVDNALKSIPKGEMGSVLIMDKLGNLTIASYRGNNNITDSFRINVKDSFIYRKNNGDIEKSAMINDVEEMIDVVSPDIIDASGGLLVGASMSVPIMVKGKVYGFLNIDSKEKGVFSESDLEFLEHLSVQAAIAMEKQMLYERTKKLSRYDELTEVCNRRYFRKIFQNELSRAKRYKEEFSLVLLDLNAFKWVNDTYGHLMGDKVLVKFSDLLKDNFRKSDTIGRIGGDEFVILVLHTKEETVVHKMERLLHKCKNQIIKVGDRSFSYDFSYGLSCYPRDGLTYNALVDAADEKMYEQKKHIKNNNKSKE
ncbi:hypothetical protein SH2C18_51830 [Clostridium sediminicola]|uniref:sensor domain-containing diguanylate cyclase n=1 Tax=Clostridium sediminicola TaxID=3114879 RepID=UPI0031F21145